jgi:purine-binding chemotaxis protein CheW
MINCQDLGMCAMQPTLVSDEQNAITNSTAVSTQDGGHTCQIVNFHLGNEEYGLDITTVQEIILMGAITKVPRVPDFVRGLINLRGKIIPVVDLRLRFGMDIAESGEHTRIIVVNASGNIFGIVVDAVNEVLRIERDQIESAPAELLGLDQSYIQGLVKREEKIMILLNIDSILSGQDQDIIAGASEAQRTSEG